MELEKKIIVRTEVLLDNDGWLNDLQNSPLLSTFPLPSINCPNIPKAVLVEVANKDIVRKLPSAITDIPHPNCQAHCTSFDHFGKRKCPNMCEWRSGV